MSVNLKIQTTSAIRPDERAAYLALRLATSIHRMEILLRGNWEVFLAVSLPIIVWPRKTAALIQEALREVGALPASYEEGLQLEQDMDGAERAMELMGAKHKAALKDALVSSANKFENAFTSSLPISDNVQLLVGLLSLTPVQAKIIEHAGQMLAIPRYRELLRCISRISAGEGYRILASMIGESEDAVCQALKPNSPIVTYGLIKIEDDPNDLEDIARIATAGRPLFIERFVNTDELKQHFLERSPSATLGPADFHYLNGVVEQMTRYLTRASAAGIRGINILLHGNPGTGKTELARVIAAAAGLEAYLVPGASKEDDPLKGPERFAHFGLMQKFLTPAVNALVIFDEVEDVFPDAPMSGFARAFGLSRPTSSDNKAWVNNQLENTRVPTIWITNTAAGIDPAFLRRFHFHLEVRYPPISVRRQIARSQLEKWIGKDIPNSLAETLAEDARLSSAAMETAVRYGTLAASCADEIPNLVLSAINQHKRAAGASEHGQSKRPQSNQFDMAFLNIESSLSAEDIVTAMERQRSIAICFYGPPGTGKTAFAEFLAGRLNKLLIARFGSELLSKYVGESEKAIAAMFAEAEDEDALLLLDECDSFLGSRERARNSWEITQTNELLQRMERFRGIFICATNRFEDLDPAVIRRFSLKIKFNSLSSVQRVMMFAREAIGDPNARVDDHQKQRLVSLGGLTPGDFSAVRQRVILSGHPVCSSNYLDELETEYRTKKQTAQCGSIGFIKAST